MRYEYFLLDFCFDHLRRFRGRSCFAICPLWEVQTSPPNGKHHGNQHVYMVVLFYLVVASNILYAHLGLKPPTSLSATHRKPQSLVRGGLRETPSKIHGCGARNG